MKQPHHLQQILIRSANWVGDAVMMTPTLRAIRKGFPSARITLLAKPWVSPVFERNPNIDTIRIYDAQSRHRGLTGLIRLAREIRASRYDMAILFQNAFEAAFLSYLAGIPHRAGFTTDGRTLLLTDRIRNWKPLKKGHLIDYYLGIVKGIGLQTDSRSLEIFLTTSEKRHAAERLQRQQVSLAAPIIGLNPGAAHGTAKRWPKERFAETAQHLIQRYKAQCLIFGASNEKQLGEELQGMIGPQSHNLAGHTTLREAMALIACCRLFLTNDSGLMHVAAALDIPQVAVIGPTDPDATGPVNRSSRIVRAPGVCYRSPCLLSHCPIDHRCMAAIGVEKVVRSAIELMEERKS